ncbi:hypothetical protein AtNW77_Chr4g0303781 [Arabidopsis thaliana]
MAIISLTLFPVTATPPPSCLFSLNRFSRSHHHFAYFSSSSPTGKILSPSSSYLHFSLYLWFISARLHSPHLLRLDSYSWLSSFFF